MGLLTPDPLSTLGLFLAGIFAGTTNTVAGGGSLVGLPALILLGGLPAGEANASNRIGVVLQSLVATGRFYREGVFSLKEGLRLLPAACLGSALGGWLSTRLSDEHFQGLIGGAMLSMLLLILLKPERWLAGASEGGALPGWGQQLLLFGVGIYGGFLQAGVGIFLLGALVWGCGMDLLKANAVKSLLVAGFTLPPLAIFLAEGMVSWAAGLTLAAGSSVGGWLGAWLAVRLGSGFLKWALVGVVILSALKLFGLFG